MLWSSCPRVLVFTRKLLPAIHKDALPFTHQSMVAYQYVCRCDCRYMSRTSQRLHDRIAQRIPKSIRNKSIPQKPCQHVIAKQKSHQSTRVILRLDFTYYKMMNKPNSTTISNFQFQLKRTPFHLAALEATYITIHQLVLCRHKKFVHALQIPH